MNTKIALCANTECLENPTELGLDGEQVLDQTWIVAFTDAMIARQYLRKHAVDETWVVSSDSVDGINLAAALKKDDARNNVRLFLSTPSGSKMSRCQNAGIIPICGKDEFARLYATRKHEHNSRIARRTHSSARNKPIEQESSSSKRSIPRVTVQRIERERTQDTSPLPVVDIEDAPQIAEAPTHFSFPKQKDHAQESAHKPAPTSNERSHINSSLLASTNDGASVVTIISGSGGTGKSSIATLTALLAQNKGFRTLLLDADLQFGDLQYLLGYEQTLDTTEILTRPEQIETLTKTDTWPALLSAPAQLEHSELMEARMTELLTYLKPHFDLIIVNTGAFWSDLQMQLLEASNQVFFLLDQRPSSIRACNHALDLCVRCGIATTSFSYLLNFCSKKSLLSALDASCALKGVKVHEIKDGGPEVGELLGAGMAHKLSKLNNSLCLSLESVLKETIYERARPSMQQDNNSLSVKGAPMNARTRFHSRQKRKAACF